MEGRLVVDVVCAFGPDYDDDDRTVVVGRIKEILDVLDDHRLIIRRENDVVEVRKTEAVRSLTSDA